MMIRMKMTMEKIGLKKIKINLAILIQMPPKITIRNENIKTMRAETIDT